MFRQIRAGKILTESCGQKMSKQIPVTLNGTEQNNFCFFDDVALSSIGLLTDSLFP